MKKWGVRKTAVLVATSTRVGLGTESEASMSIPPKPTIVTAAFSNHGFTHVPPLLSGKLCEERDYIEVIFRFLLLDTAPSKQQNLTTVCWMTDKSRDATDETGI